MFKQLKECKTLKEIYTILGTEPFEKVAFILVVAWCLLPFYSAIEHFYWGIVGVNDLQKEFAVMEGYRIIMQLVGDFSFYFSIFYLLGRVAVNRGTIFHKLKQEPWHFLLLMMLLWSCISTLLSDDIATSFYGTSYRFDGLKSYFYYAAAYVCAFIVIQSKRRKKVMNVFTGVASLISVILILQDWGVQFVTQGFLDERSAVFFHFNHAGYYLNLSIVCLMGLYLFENTRKWRIYYTLSMILQIYALLVNSTLGGFLGTCGALVMLLLFFVRSQGKLSWRMVTPVMVVILLSVASYMGLVPTSSGEDMRVNLETMTQDASKFVGDTSNVKYAGHGRVELWQQSLKMVRERPIFGYGPEQVNESYMEHLWTNRASNEFIQYAVFLGVPGVLFYLVALFWLFIHQWLYMKRLDTTTLVAAGCVIAYLISAMFGNTMFYTTPYFYMFLAFAAGRAKSSSQI